MSTYILSIIAEGKDNASGPLNKLSGALSGVGTITAGILSAGLFTQIGQAISSMGSQALAATATWERLGMAITTMTAREMRNIDTTLSQADALEKAGDKAKTLMGWIQELAISSPFDAESVAQTFKMAMTYGFTADEAQRLTQILADMSSGMGLTGDQMNGVAFALGQINKGDKLLMQDLRQLMGVGVPVNEILEAMGYGFEDIGKKAISSSDFIKMFSKIMEEDFAGSAKLAASGWMGLTNSMSDIKQIGLREFFSSTFSAIQPYVQRFVDKFSDPAFQESLRKWGEPLGELAAKFMEFVSLVKPSMDEMRSRSFMPLDFAGQIKKKIDEIDWVGIGDSIQAGIESIDWPGLGIKIREKTIELFQNVAGAADDADLGTIVATAITGMSEALASGITGQQITLESSLAGYQAFGDGVKNAIKGWQLKTETGIVEWYMSNHIKMQEWKANVSQSIFDAISGIVPMIAGAIRLWNTPVDQELTRIKNTFVTSVTSWVQGSIKTLLTMGPLLIQALTDLMTKLRNSIKPVSFSINLPNFDHLVEQALEGAQRVQDALKGQGIKGGKSTNPNGGGGSGSGSSGGNGNDVQSFSGGGIATGPMSGYFANLHGTEAVIPMKNGSIPVALNAPRSDGGGVVNNSNTITINVNGSDNPETVAREIFRILKVQGVTA